MSAALAERFVNNILWYEDNKGRTDEEVDATIENRRTILTDLSEAFGYDAESTGSVVFGAILTSPFEGTQASEATTRIEHLLDEIQKVRGDRQRELDYLRFTLGELTTNPIEEKEKFGKVEETLKSGFNSVDDSEDSIESDELEMENDDE